MRTQRRGWPLIAGLRNPTSEAPTHPVAIFGHKPVPCRRPLLHIPSSLSRVHPTTPLSSQKKDRSATIARLCNTGVLHDVPDRILIYDNYVTMHGNTDPPPEVTSYPKSPGRNEFARFYPGFLSPKPRNPEEKFCGRTLQELLPVKLRTFCQEVRIAAAPASWGAREIG